MPRLGTGLSCVLLLALTVVAYAPVRHNGFVDIDDQVYITDNDHVREGLTPANVAWAWTTIHGNYWQPLSWLSLQWDAHWFSTRGADGVPVPSAFAFHAQNLFWHSASVLLLFGLLRRLTGATRPSFLVAALFAVHPLRVESVAWAAERKDVLCVFFGLVALHAYVWYCKQPSRYRYEAVVAAFMASLLCKPMLLTMPAVLLLLDFWPLRRLALFQATPDPEHPPVALRRLLLEKVPLLVLAAAIGALTMWSRHQMDGVFSFAVLPLADRLANIPAAYAWYVTHTFYPRGLGVLYLHPRHDWSLPALLYGTALLLAVTGISVWQARRRPWLLVGWLWFVGTLVPVIGIFQGGEQSWADRFTYWPHTGLLIAIVWGLAEIARRWHVPVPARAALGAAAIAGCCVLTWTQIGYWANTESLWQRVIAVTEGNHLAHVRLAQWYYGQGEIGLAAPQYEAAMQLRPELATYQYNVGLMQLLLGRTDRAVQHLQQAVAQDPAYGDAWHNLGVTRLREGKPELAVACFRKALELAPDQSHTRTELGRALWRSGKRTEAIQRFQEALASNPVEPHAWQCLGLAHLAHGDANKAVEALSKSLQLLPTHQDAWSELGIAYGRLHRWADAARCHAQAAQTHAALEQNVVRMHGTVPEPDGIAPWIVFQCRLGFALNMLDKHGTAAAVYRAATQRDPHWPDKLAATAWRLATDPAVRDPQLALETAQQAIEGTHGHPSARLLDALAASQAALGHFPEAVHCAEEALVLADGTTAASIRAHLVHYKHREAVTASSR